MTSNQTLVINPTELCTVRFYSVTVGGPPHGPAMRFDASKALTEIDQLPLSFTDTANTRYQHRRNDRSLHTIVDSSGSGEVCFRFCEVNRADLPQIEAEGAITDLQLEEREGLMEATHCIAFKPGLLAAVSKRGPSPTSLGKYILAKIQDSPGSLDVVPLVHMDIISRLQRLQTISLMELKLSPSQIPIVRGASDDLDKLFEAQLAMWNEQSRLEVIIRPAQSSVHGARQKLLGPIVDIAGRAGWFAKESTYKVRGRSETQAREVTLNILSDSITTEESVERSRERSSALDNDSAFNAIRNAYMALEPDIEEALGDGTL